MSERTAAEYFAAAERALEEAEDARSHAWDELEEVALQRALVYATMAGFGPAILRTTKSLTAQEAEAIKARWLEAAGKPCIVLDGGLEVQPQRVVLEDPPSVVEDEDVDVPVWVVFTTLFVLLALAAVGTGVLLRAIF